MKRPPAPPSPGEYDRLKAAGIAKVRAGEHREALAAFERAREAAGAGKDPDLVHEATANVSMVLIQLGEDRRAEAGLREILLRSRNPKILFGAAYNLAVSQRKQGRYERARFYALKAMENAGKVRDASNRAGCHNLLGNILMNESRLDEALVEYRKALRIRRRQRGDARFSIAILLENIGYTWLLKKQFRRGAAAITRALEVATEVGAKRCTAESFQDLCYAHMQMKKYSVATLYGERALALAKENGYRDVEKNCYYLLGESAHLDGRRGGARPSLRQPPGTLPGAAAPARFPLRLRPERHHHPETMTMMNDQPRRLPVSPIPALLAGLSLLGAAVALPLPARAATLALSPAGLQYSVAAEPRSSGIGGSSGTKVVFRSQSPDGAAQAWVLPGTDDAVMDVEPALAVCPVSGLPAVAWSRPDAAGYQIFVSLYDGARWSAPRALTADARGHRRPQLQCGASGRIRLMWTAGLGADGSPLFYEAVLDAKGASLLPAGLVRADVGAEISADAHLPRRLLGRGPALRFRGGLQERPGGGRLRGTGRADPDRPARGRRDPAGRLHDPEHQDRRRRGQDRAPVPARGQALLLGAVLLWMVAAALDRARHDHRGAGRDPGPERVRDRADALTRLSGTGSAGRRCRRPCAG